jgi:hypothetical protein
MPLFCYSCLQVSGPNGKRIRKKEIESGKVVFGFNYRILSIVNQFLRSCIMLKRFQLR